MAVGKEEVEILKPRTDKREYRRIVLPNRLEVLLISDPETDKAAASMDVSVGSFSNPEGLEGLAHFLGLFSYITSASSGEKNILDCLWSELNNMLFIQPSILTLLS